MISLISLRDFLEKVDIFFEGSLISKELIIKRYSDFFTESFDTGERFVNIALHTGSICFDAISLIIAALETIVSDDTKVDDVLDSLKGNQTVTYGETSKRKYTWRGFADSNLTILRRSDSKDDRFFAVLQENAKKRGEKNQLFLKQDRWRFISPCDGVLGKGRRELTGDNGSRVDFLSYLAGQTLHDVSNTTTVSTIVVAKKSDFNKISEGIKIKYGSKTIDFLDLFPTSYFTSKLTEYRYRGNSEKNTPVLKITENISTARDLILDRGSGNIIGLVIIGTDKMLDNMSEISDLLDRKSLQFIQISTDIDSKKAEDIIDISDNASILAFTKAFIVENSSTISEKNEYTLDLEKRNMSIVEHTVTPVIMEGGCSEEEYRKVKNLLFQIQASEWPENEKNQFLRQSYALLNLFMTAVFTMDELENKIDSGIINLVRSPKKRIEELYSLAKNSDEFTEQCGYVISILERLYLFVRDECPKCTALQGLIEDVNVKNIAVIVPKQFYLNLINYPQKSNKKISFYTGNNFDYRKQFDLVISIGDFISNQFNPWRCHSASDIRILLYECEKGIFEHKGKRFLNFERKMNQRSGIITHSEDIIEDEKIQNEDCKEENEFIKKSFDFEQYIDELNKLDIKKFISSEQNEYAAASEVDIIGRFVDGRYVFFSRYARMLVFDPNEKTVKETDPDDLKVGDIMVYAKRDGKMRNMVDLVYDNLRDSGKLNSDIIHTENESNLWRSVLREHMTEHDLSFQEVSFELRKHGSGVHEATVRQWLHEESHIIGPRDIESVRHIAKCTKNDELLNKVEECYESCRKIRKLRRKILKMIETAIVDSMSGNKSEKGNMFDMIYDDVENLSESIELEHLTTLDESITVPIGLINRPIELERDE